MEFKFKEQECIWSDDYLYHLVEGGQLKPEKLLVDPDQITKVREAITTIREYLQQAEDAGIIDYA